MHLSFFLLFFFWCILPLSAQRTRNVAWFTPSSCSTSRINGLALGLLSGCFEDGDYPQTINGMDIELFGVGFFLPLAGGNGSVEADTTLVTPMQTVNGVVISPGGFGGFGAVVNGLNLSGIYSVIQQTNGLSTGLIFCDHKRVNGVVVGGIFGNDSDLTNGVQIGGLASISKKMNGLQIAIINRTNFLKGVQIGLINRAKKMKGLQIGFINMSGNRTLPFLNLQF